MSSGLTDRTFRNIRAALETRFNEISEITNKEFENTKTKLEDFDKSSSDVKFIRGTILPLETSVVAVGSSGTDLHEGIFQIDYYSAVDVGGYSDDLDIIANYFPKGHEMTHSSHTVKVRNVSLGVGRRDGAFFVRNIDVDYFAYTAARS